MSYELYVHQMGDRSGVSTALLSETCDSDFSYRLLNIYLNVVDNAVDVVDISTISHHWIFATLRTSTK